MADTIERAPIDGAVNIPVGLIKPNAWNRKINEAGLNDLAASIRQHQVLQPILVRPIDDATAGAPLYELIAGERRWRASQLAGQATIPALVRPMDDLEVIELMLVENLEREELHPLDEALGYDRLLRKDSGPQALRGFATVEALAERIGKSRAYIVQRLTLLKLCPEGVKAFRAGDLTFSTALRVARITGAKDQAQATAEIAKGWGGNPMSARDADEYIRRTFMLDLARAPFKATDEALVPDAGSCTACSKRTGANPDLFGDIKSGDTCTDGACYERKAEAQRAAIKQQAEGRGLQVVAGAEARKCKPHAYGEVKGLLKLDEVHHNIDAKKSLRKLLAKADVKTVLFEDPHSHDLVEMVPAEQALAALKAAGVLQAAKLPKTSQAERDTAERNRRETAWRTATAEACLDAAKGEAGAAPDYRARLIKRIAVLLWAELHNDSRVRITKLLGWPPLKSRWDTGPGTTAEQHIGSLGDGELCRYLTAAAISGETHIAQYQGVSEPAALLACAADLGVDVAAIKIAMRKPDRVRTAAAKARTAAQLTPEKALAASLKRATAQRGIERGVKYRNADTGETWTGRGLQPKWLKVALAGGKTLADFLTTPPAVAGTTAQEGAHHE